MDILQDTSRRHFVNIASIIGLDDIPLYVKQYDIPNEKQASAFRDETFADRDHREYGLESPGATWLSAAYLAYNSRGNIQDSDVAANIKRAADTWGISKDVSRAVRKIREHFEKLAAKKEPEDSDYGLIVYDQGGTKKRKYPMFCAADVEKAAEYFEDNRKAYPVKVRKVITTRILQKAAEFGVDEESLPECIFKEAGMCIPDRNAILDELEVRALTVKDKEVATLADNTAKLVKAADADELAGVMDAVAETIEACDIVDGRADKYGTKYAFPADIIYGMPYKQAAEMCRRVVILDGTAFDAVKMASEIPSDTFVELLGPDFVANISINGAINPDKLAQSLNKLAFDAQFELCEALKSLFA